MKPSPEKKQQQQYAQTNFMPNIRIKQSKIGAKAFGICNICSANSNAPLSPPLSCAFFVTVETTAAGWLPKPPSITKLYGN